MSCKLSALTLLLALPVVLTGCGGPNGGEIEHPRELVEALQDADTSFCADAEDSAAEQEEQLSEDKDDAEDGWDRTEGDLAAELTDQGYADSQYGDCWFFVWNPGFEDAEELREYFVGNNTVTGENWVVVAEDDVDVDAMQKELGGQAGHAN